MYLNQFGLSESPFSLTPDTQFFFNKLSYRSALNLLVSAIKNNEGFVKIVGEVGTGKTLLSRKLLAQLDDSYHVITIANSYLTPNELKGLVAQEIGAKTKPDMPAYQLMSSIYRALLDLVKKGKQVVLVVDEAQAMPRDTLEALRLLSNMETDKHKLMQTVLIGQPELDQLLARADLRQLSQRIAFTATLTPLNAAAVGEYVDFRLDSAGAKSELFSGPGKRLLYWGSGGVPRLVNVLAHKALIAAANTGVQRVGYRQVRAAINDSPEAKPLGRAIALGGFWLLPLAGAGAGIMASLQIGALI